MRVLVISLLSAKKVDGLLVADRCVSATREALGAIILLHNVARVPCR